MCSERAPATQLPGRRCRRSPPPLCNTTPLVDTPDLMLLNLPLPHHAASLQAGSRAMPRRKASAPQRDQGRFEDRFLAGGTEAAAEEEAAGQLWEEWQAGGSEAESEEVARRRPAKRRRKLQKRGRGAAAAAEEDGGGLSVVVAAAAPDEQHWRFAELPLQWQAVAGPSHQQAAADMLEEGQLLLSLEEPPFCSDGMDSTHSSGGSSGSIAVRCQVSGAWQGSVAAPDAAAAEALLLLLRSGHLSCSLVGPPGAPNGGTKCTLALSLTDKATGEPAEHPEEQQQRLWHRQLLAVVRWLLPHLDPEAELEQQVQRAQQAQQGSAADRAAELLSSPLCSPRKAGGDPAGAALWPASPRSPGGGSAAAAAAAASAFDAAELYAAVKPSGREPELPAGATSATLLPTLRRYQARAAQWMVQRERGGGAAVAEQPASRAGAAVGAAAAAAAALGLDSSTGGVKQEQHGHQQESRQQQTQQEQQDALPQPLHPLWRAVPCSNVGSTRSGGDGSGSSTGNSIGGNSIGSGSGSSSCFYFNPYNGRIAFDRFAAEPEVSSHLL